MNSLRAERVVLVALCAAAVLMAGCSFGGSRTRIMDPIEAPIKATSMRVVEGEHTANVPEEEMEEILERFNEKLHKKGRFVEGQEMTLEYRIVLFDPGDQFARYMLGFGAGEGEIIVEATFRDQAQQKIAKIEASGRLTAGTFGGGFRDAYNRVIKEIVTFATSNFLHADTT